MQRSRELLHGKMARSCAARKRGAQPVRSESAAADAALRLGPDTAEGHTSDALVHQLEWALEAAESEFRRALALSPGYEPARHRLALLLAWLALGNEDRALELLEEAAAERSPQLVRVNADPAFAKLRAQPRFKRVMDRIG